MAVNRAWYNGCRAAGAVVSSIKNRFNMHHYIIGWSAHLKIFFSNGLFSNQFLPRFQMRVPRPHFWGEGSCASCQENPKISHFYGVI
jgi:hypothetical protein